jgi:ubiquinone/menaquinone biosynthesis C-methylase UbiE
MATYDKFAKFYFDRRSNKKRFDYNRDIEVPALIKLIGNVKNKTLLDVGCGFGDHAKILSKQNYQKLIGFDISKELIKLAKQQQIPQSFFYIGDMNKRFNHKDSSFDIVYASLVIHYVKNPVKLFKEVNRVLKKGGIFCFSTGHPLFELINQTDKHMVGVIKQANGKRIILGNYFDESPKKNDLGGLGKMKVYNFTFETLIKAGLDNCFELIDYKDARPTPISKKYDAEKYRVTTTLPTFILFKFRKK